MRFRTGRRRPRLAELSLTPLIDIVFNLLIFFLMSSTFDQRAGLEVELPDTEQPPSQPGEHDVVVSVTRDGALHHKGREVTADQLRGRLVHHKERHPNAAVIIDADEGSRHGVVVQVMSVAREAGFTDVAIAADTAP